MKAREPVEVVIIHIGDLALRIFEIPEDETERLRVFELATTEFCRLRDEPLGLGFGLCLNPPTGDSPASSADAER